MSHAFLAGGDTRSPGDPREQKLASPETDAGEVGLTEEPGTSGPPPGKKAGSADRWLAGQLLRTGSGSADRALERRGSRLAELPPIGRNRPAADAAASRPAPSHGC